MIKMMYTIVTLFVFNSLYGQQLMKMKIIGVGESETPFSNMIPTIDPKGETIVAVMGGLNNWDGMNNYFNVYGSKVIIQSREVAYNGIINITLRREDGRNFYGLYPTIRAQLSHFNNEGGL